MLTRITWSESPIGQRVAVRSSPAFCPDIQFVDTYRGAEYQVTRYANWRLGRLASRRYLKENKGVRWWIFWRARLWRGWIGWAWLGRTWIRRTRLRRARLGRTRLWRPRLGRTRLWWARLWWARFRRATQAGSDRHCCPAAGWASKRRADCAAR